MPPPELPPRKRKREEREEEQVERKKPKDWTWVLVLIFIVPGLVYFVVIGAKEILQEESTEPNIKREAKKVDSTPETIDLDELYELYVSNMPAALNKYNGRTIEFSTATADIYGGNEDVISVRFNVESIKPKTRDGFCKIVAMFSFDDPRNQELKTLKDGPFKRKIVGKIKKIEYDDLRFGFVRVMVENSHIQK